MIHCKQGQGTLQHPMCFVSSHPFFRPTEVVFLLLWSFVSIIGEAGVTGWVSIENRRLMASLNGFRKTSLQTKGEHDDRTSIA